MSSATATPGPLPGPADLPRAVATRYVTPLREGGSLPAIMEASDLGTYVVKFRGAGQGPKALVAEVICGLLARGCGLAAPELAVIDVSADLAPGEPDQEIQDLLRASAGPNLGVDFLPGALDFDAARAEVDGALAGRILWFDALTGNVDRSWRNPNLLWWHGTLYLIDHGAALTFQHRWETAEAAVTRPYDAAEHALIGCAPQVEQADAELAGRITGELLRAVVAAVPDDWLGAEPGFAGTAGLRDAYVSYLSGRIGARRDWLPALAEAAAAGAPARLAADRGRRAPGWLTGSPRRPPGRPPEGTGGA